MKKGFTLIELLAVIVILAIIALIVTPVVSNIVANARIAANARSVEGHIRNIELAIITKAFGENSTGDLDKYDNITGGTTIESSLTLPDNDNVVCKKYNIKHGTVLSAENCKDKDKNWNKKYGYTNDGGAIVTGEVGVSDFKGTVIWPELDSNGNPTQNKISNTLSLPMTDASGKSIVTYLGIVYIDPSNIKNTCTIDSTISVTNTGCKKFYIYKDTVDSYKMIMDRNLNNSVSCYSNLSTTLSSLNTSWAGAGEVDMISADEVAHIVGADREDTIKWSSDKTYANNVTDMENQISWFYLDGGRNETKDSYCVKEGNSSTCTDGWRKSYCSTQGCSNYAWLFDYLYGSSSSGGNYSYGSNTSRGYWTSTPSTYSFSNQSYMYGIRDFGELGNVQITNSGCNYGLRPVITVDKDLIDG